MTAEADKYWLATNCHASARLNLQHFWNELSCGHLIHPDIHLGEKARIVDIGTGTGIWPISLSARLPSTVQLDGFDISDAQFPPVEWLPSNVALSKWNIFDPVPEPLVGQYDLVNIRYFGLVVRPHNLSTLIQSLISLLKPGGYLQWTEVNIPGQQICAANPAVPLGATAAFSEDGLKAIATFGALFDWLPYLDKILQERGLVETKQFRPEPIPGLQPMSSYLAIGGWEEFSYNVLDPMGAHPILGTGEDLRTRINHVRREVQAGVAIQQLHYVTIGRRPS